MRKTYSIACQTCRKPLSVAVELDETAVALPKSAVLACPACDGRIDMDIDGGADEEHIEVSMAE